MSPLTYNTFNLISAESHQYVIFLVMLIFGFAISFIMYHKFRMRVPGVIATPLLAIYTLDDFWTLILVTGVSIIIFFILRILYLRYFLYGRRLFLIGAIFSIVLSAPLLALFHLGQVVILTILPAIFAYNMVLSIERRALSLGLLVGDLILLVGLGMLLTSLWRAA